MNRKYLLLGFFLLGILLLSMNAGFAMATDEEEGKDEEENGGCEEGKDECEDEKDECEEAFNRS